MQADVLIGFVQWQRHREIAMNLRGSALDLFDIGPVSMRKVARHLRKVADTHVAPQQGVLNGFFLRGYVLGRFDLIKHRSYRLDDPAGTGE